MRNPKKVCASVRNVIANTKKENMKKIIRTNLFYLIIYFVCTVGINAQRVYPLVSGKLIIE